MKKAVYAALVAAAALVAGSAQAQTPDLNHEDAVRTASVRYTCQGGKRLTVTYGFNRQDLPVYASAYMNGKRRYMPVNLNVSDRTATTFGDENNFKLSTDYLDRRNYRSRSVMVTSPGQELIYKSCRPRR
ncbi:MAG: adhesin [Eikenella sp.]|nr:adhesin [Eikenella sp.]